MSQYAKKLLRAGTVNQAIRIIADHGRRFFYSDSQDRYASIEVDYRGRIWWIDDYSGKRIYTHKAGLGNEWYGFTHGGTLRHLVERFRDYVSTGIPISTWLLGPQREWDVSNIWGYPEEDMQKVRELAGALPCFDRQLAGGGK